MSIALDEALKDVKLETGQTYRCQVGDVRVELRVFPAATLDLDSEAMMDPWVELPHPMPYQIGTMPRGVLRLPDPPIIPPEDESE